MRVISLALTLRTALCRFSLPLAPAADCALRRHSTEARLSRRCIIPVLEDGVLFRARLCRVGFLGFDYARSHSDGHSSFISLGQVTPRLSRLRSPGAALMTLCSPSYSERCDGLSFITYAAAPARHAELSTAIISNTLSRGQPERLMARSYHAKRKPIRAIHGLKRLTILPHGFSAPRLPSPSARALSPLDSFSQAMTFILDAQLMPRHELYLMNA